jgi:hypothetical protein
MIPALLVRQQLTNYHDLFLDAIYNIPYPGAVIVTSQKCSPFSDRNSPGRTSCASNYFDSSRKARFKLPLLDLCTSHLVGKYSHFGKYSLGSFILRNKFSVEEIRRPFTTHIY